MAQGGTDMSVQDRDQENERLQGTVGCGGQECSAAVYCTCEVFQVNWFLGISVPSLIIGNVNWESFSFQR